MEEESGCSQLERAEGSGMDTPGLGERFFSIRIIYCLLALRLLGEKMFLEGMGLMCKCLKSDFGV